MSWPSAVVSIVGLCAIFGWPRMFTINVHRHYHRETRRRGEDGD